MWGEVFCVPEPPSTSCSTHSGSLTNPAVMSHRRGCEHPQSKATQHPRWLSKTATQAIPGGWAPALPHLPESTQQESQLHQFSDPSPLLRQELSLGLTSLGDVNTAKIPLINRGPPLDQWLALGELSTVLLVWLPSCRCYR